MNESRSFMVSEIVESLDADDTLVGNCSLANFRTCLGKIEMGDNQTAAIDQVTALELRVKVGEIVRTVELKAVKSEP